MNAKHLTLMPGAKGCGAGKLTINPMNDCSQAEWLATLEYMKERMEYTEATFWVELAIRHACLFLYDCTKDPENRYYSGK